LPVKGQLGAARAQPLVEEFAALGQ